MLVPRVFLFGSAPPNKTTRPDVKDRPSTPQRGLSEKVQEVSRLQSPNRATGDVTRTDPVVIPTKRAPRRTPVTPVTSNRGRGPRKDPSMARRSPSMAVRDGNVPPSVATLLEVTAIPRPRRSQSVRSSRRLPPGDHVGDFSRLLMEGMIDSSGNAALDLLLSPPDEDNEKSMFDNDYELGTPRSFRSMSTDSTPSLDNESDSYTPSSGVPATPSPSRQRSPLERRYRQLSPSEECTSDHPLMDREDDSIDQFFGSSDAAPPKSPTPSRSFRRLGSFKSNLTASLRAIKSAAQTVSNFATPSLHSDDFFTRSLFAITPKLTDDRRPRPMDEPPSPALRRYLNPFTASPAEMHVYHEHPYDPMNTSNACPVSIQMQTYHRFGRNGSRRSGFSVASSGEKDHPYSFFDPEIPPMWRQREPRENSDFLRMVVLEMNMRRSGKLRDDIPTRARVWLPPRKVNPSRLSPYNVYDDEDDGPVPQRWIGISVECV